jgi:hypothetical protein
MDVYENRIDIDTKNKDYSTTTLKTSNWQHTQKKQITNKQELKH